VAPDITVTVGHSTVMVAPGGKTFTVEMKTAYLASNVRTHIGELLYILYTVMHYHLLPSREHGCCCSGISWWQLCATDMPTGQPMGPMGLM